MSTDLSGSDLTAKREIYMDLVKTFAIFLVLAGHCIQYFLSSEHSDEPGYRLIYSFHMPIFMMVVGFFFSRSVKPEFVNMVLKKFRQLILPLLSWGVLIALAVRMFAEFPSVKDILSAWKYSLWFLKSAFLCCVLGYFVFALFFLDAEVYADSTSIMYNKYEGSKLTATLLLFYRIVMGVSGSILVIGCFYRLTEKVGDNAVLNTVAVVGKYTLAIYILQTIVLEVIMARYINMDDVSVLTFHIVVVPAISIGVILLSIVIVKLIECNRDLSFLFLGKARR